MRVDSAAAGGAGRPAVLLVTAGSPARASALATAAANYFGIAGLETRRQSIGGGAAELAEALHEHGTTVVCICAGADVEPAASEQLAVAVEAAGATRVYSAASLPADARAELSDLLDHLGVP
jgi:hypothetical protein